MIGFADEISELIETQDIIDARRYRGLRDLAIHYRRLEAVVACNQLDHLSSADEFDMQVDIALGINKQ